METLYTGLGLGESPRWHEGRLWVANWGFGEVVAIDMQGRAEVMASVPGEDLRAFSIDWLPDGTLLVTQPPRARLLRQQPDGHRLVHSDRLLTPDGALREVADGLEFPNGMVITPCSRVGRVGAGSRTCKR